MTSIFLILGYGIPKNIFKDKNYNFYLKTVFNKVYDLVTKNKIKAPIFYLKNLETKSPKNKI